MTDDIEKIKIDILRDALKDTTDTLRAIDKKTQFLISYNAIFLGLIGTIFFKGVDSNISILWNKAFLFIPLGILTIYWIIFFKKLMENFSPAQNPLESFCSNNDKNFANDTFFVYVTKEKCKCLEQLVRNFDKEIDSEKNIKKLLYKEIVKVSSMRDKRISIIQNAVKTSSKLTMFLVGILIIYLTVGYILING